MKWELSTINQYIENQEYIDTAIVPIVRIGLGDQLKSCVTQATWLTGVANHLEEQLTGRVLLFPIYSFSDDSETSELRKLLSTYARFVRHHGFQHVVFLVDEPLYKLLEGKCDADLISVQSAHIENDEWTNEEVIQQAQKLVSSLIKIWKK